MILNRGEQIEKIKEKNLKVFAKACLFINGLIIAGMFYFWYVKSYNQLLLMSLMGFIFSWFVVINWVTDH